MDQASARRLLGVGQTATRREIEAAFRTKVLANHPDRGGDADAFRSVVDARRALLEAPVRRPPPVTVVPDGAGWRSLLMAIARRLIDRDPPSPRVR